MTVSAKRCKRQFDDDRSFMTHMAHQRTQGATRAVIWDVDGTLIDSGALHYETWVTTLEQEQVAVTPQQFQDTFGQRNDAVLRAFLGPDLSDADSTRISDAKETLYRDLVRERGMEALPGVHRWLEALHAAGWRQAIASSAPAANLDVIVAAMGVAHYFDAIVSAYEVGTGKPDPAIFLLAAERLGVDPARCVVVEDAHVGVLGARRAGMYTVGVLSSHDTLDADVVVASLDLLPADAFERLVPLQP
jgi:beta-phosphoglucomutase